MKIIKTLKHHLNHDFQELRRYGISLEPILQQPERFTQRLENETNMITRWPLDRE
jgi:hypothetical protein